MAWKIIRDHLYAKGDYGSSQVGRKNAGDYHFVKDEPTFKARLYDDDHELYYTAEFNLDAFENDETLGGLYTLYEWAMYDSGCTHLAIHLDDLVAMGVPENSMKTFCELAWKQGDRKGWVSIYA